MLALIKNLRHPAGLLGLAIAIGIPFLVYFAPHAGQKELVGALDLNLPFWLYTAQLVAALALLAGLGKDFWEWLRPHLPSRTWAILLGVVLLAATAMAIGWIEPRHRVQSDESIFLTTAQNMFHRQAAGACDEGTFSLQGLDCTKTSHNFKAKGMAFAYALGMPILGDNLSWVFNFQLALLILTIPLFFLAIKVWTADDFLALVATALLAAQPTLLFQFRAASVEPLYVFLSALGLLFLKWAYDKDTVRHWVLLALVLAFFTQTRQETVFCLGAFLLVAAPKLLSAQDLRAPAFLATLSYFSLPVLLTISYYQGYNFQGGEFDAHGHFFEHLSSNWPILTEAPMQDGLLGNPFLSSFAWLSLFGTITLVFLAARDFVNPAKRKKSLWVGTFVFLVLYHIQSYMILENVSGDFSIEINQRYFLVMLPTMAFLGALFLRQAVLNGVPLLLGIAKPGAGSLALLGSAAAVALVILGNTARHEDSFRQNIMYNRNHLTTEEHAILQWVRAQPEKPRLFIYARPWHFIGYGYSSRHYEAAMRQSPEEFQKLVEQYQGEVYYVRGLDCWDSKTYHRKAVEHRIATVCDQFEDKFDIETLLETPITNNYLLTIGRITNGRDYSMQGVFTPGIFQYFPEEKRVLLSYALSTQSAKPWKLQQHLNGQLVYDKPYQNGNYLDTLPATGMKAGYNNWQITVTDTLKGRVVYRNTQQQFFAVDNATPLTRLAPAAASVSWGELQTNRSVMGNALTVAGTRYDEGLGSHAFTSLRYELEGRYDHFSALVGLDDEEMCSDGIRVRLYADGKLLADSGDLPPGKLHPLDVALAGAKSLVIEADSLGNKNCDHVDIIQPTLIPARK
jgi:hypothetical protein